MVEEAAGANYWPHVRSLAWPLFIFLNILFLLGIIVPFYAGGGQFLSAAQVYSTPGAIKVSADPLFSILTQPFGGLIFNVWGCLAPPLALGLLVVLPFRWRGLSAYSRVVRLITLLLWLLMVVLALSEMKKLGYWVLD